MSPPSYAALLNEIATLREELEDLRASAIAWRELYEAAAKRCGELEKLIRQLGAATRPPRKRRRGPIQRQRSPMPEIPTTGVVCPSCKQPVVVIENMMPGTVVLHCPACGHRSSVSEPGKGKH